MTSQSHELRLPNLGLDGAAITVSCWLVRRGTAVMQGDRLLEVLAGEVTVDLASPASGVLVRQAVEEDDPVVTGQLLGVIRG
jgi:pyruvate/2-oxoglutarate dehydrogenase complex dihydrolipoamide acyltransferase (E2) component